MQTVRAALLPFLSTPSGWRATVVNKLLHRIRFHFYPRPPGGGRRITPEDHHQTNYISIHALRVEGDRLCNIKDHPITIISIHALRVEGDA